MTDNTQDTVARVDRFVCHEEYVRPYETGDYVLHEDYAAKEAECERLTRERDAARKDSDMVRQMLKVMERDYAERVATATRDRDEWKRKAEGIVVTGEMGMRACVESRGGLANWALLTDEDRDSELLIMEDALRAALEQTK